MFRRSSHSSFYYHMIVSLTVSCLLHTCHGSCNRLDRESLSRFQRGISAASPLNWSVSEDCCRWEGVGCDASGRVTALWLPSRGLSGGLSSSSIQNLSGLSRLNLSHNWISGHLPNYFFSYLNHLQVLDLSNNRIRGGLSTSDELPETLRTLNLSSKYLDGTIPAPFLQKAVNLESLDVSNNRFSGSIPSSVCSVAPSIRKVDFSTNEFTGAIPPGFGHCTNLQSFRSGFNDISGEVAALDIYRLMNLQELYLPGNRLSGRMDEGISNLVNLEILALQGNSLIGNIPTDIGRLSKLETLMLHENQLSGAIPASLANCTRLATLSVRVNFLKGRLLDFDFSKLVHLRTIDLGFNFFSGGIPISLFSCKKLTAIRLADNDLDGGEILPEITVLKSLSFLSVSRSGLTNIKSALTILSGCKNLRTLLLSNNFYDEEVPGNEVMINHQGFQNLQTLSLRNSRLTGSIPLWMSKLNELKVIDLGGNCFTGPIPGWLGTLPNLFFIQLAGNRLSGHFPVELTKLPRLAAEANPEQPETSYYELPVFNGVASDMQYNSLASIPRALFLSNNSIIGSIPEEIGNMKSLAILKLDHNSFSGSIPSTISNLTNLEMLDLSGNNLSGEIPASLGNLHFLSYFNVSRNNLEGPVPTGGQFLTFPSSSFEGNPELCGQVIQHRPCQGRPHPHAQGATEGLQNANEMINWLSFELSYAVSFIVTVLAAMKLST